MRLAAGFRFSFILEKKRLPHYIDQFEKKLFFNILFN